MKRTGRKSTNIEDLRSQGTPAPRYPAVTENKGSVIIDRTETPKDPNQYVRDGEHRKAVSKVYRKATQGW